MSRVCLSVFASPSYDTLVTSNASPEAQSLYAYLEHIYGKKILSGQQDSAQRLGENEFEINYIKEVTGKLPAIRAFDLSPYTPPDSHRSASLIVVQRAIDWYDHSNGIVALCWHWRAPLGRKTTYSKETAFSLGRGLQEGTPEHAAILRDLDAIAAQLAKLRDAHVPVLWRPLHEANGRWFWWGAHGPVEFKALWQLMFDRFVGLHKLNNLIWVYSPGAEVDLTDWYPGNRYVDIIGQDNYPMDNNHGPAKNIFNELVALGRGNKMVGLSENGPIPDINQVISEEAGWLFFSTWSGKSLTENNSKEFLTRVFNNPYVANLDDLPKLKDYPFKLCGPPVKLGFLAFPVDLAVGQPGRQPLAVAIHDVDGRTVRINGIKVNLKLASQPDDAQLHGHLTSTTVNGVAVFADAVIDKPGTGYRLIASAKGLKSGRSPAFNVGPGNGILREWWTDSRSFRMKDLSGHAPVVAEGASREVLGEGLEVPYSVQTNFAECLRGYLLPTRSGSYKFQLVSDGLSELWLSSNENPAKKIKIAEITERVPYSKWPDSHEVWSKPVTLEAGKRYYIEVLHNQKLGRAVLWVSWRLPNGTMQIPIPSANLSCSDAKATMVNRRKEQTASKIVTGTSHH